MRILSIFYVIQTAVAIKYPPVTTWGLPEVEDELVKDFSNSCIDVVLGSFHSSLNQSPYSQNIIKEEDAWAVVPSPTGGETWSIDELKDTASIIIEGLGLDRKATRKPTGSKSLSLQQVENAIEMLMPNNRPINTTGDWIKMSVLDKLQTIFEDEAMGRDNKKDGYQLKILVLDLSVWKSDELHQALEKTNTNPKLVPFLDFAVHEDSDSKLDNGKICVVTPVNVMPSKERYYYLPPSTKCLLKKVRKLIQNKDKHQDNK